MKIIHYLNCLLYLITIVPYISFYYYLYGLYAQILLGPVQLILAAILLFNKNKLSVITKKHLNNYWIAVILNIVFIGVLYIFKENAHMVFPLIILFIIPMVIASYFIYITFLAKRGHDTLKNNKI